MARPVTIFTGQWADLKFDALRALFGINLLPAEVVNPDISRHPAGNVIEARDWATGLVMWDYSRESDPKREGEAQWL